MIDGPGTEGLGRSVIQRLGPHVLEREAVPSTLLHDDPPAELVPVDHPEVDVAVDHQPFVAADRAEQPLAVIPHPGLERAVVEPRRDPHLELHRPTDAFQDTQDLVVGIEAHAG